LTSAIFAYKEDGILANGSKVPDIPFINLLIVRRDLKKRESRAVRYYA